VNLLFRLYILLVVLFSSATNATRSLSLQPVHANFTFPSGYSVKLQASKDGERLLSVSISNGTYTFTVPENELSNIIRPDLSAVQVVGGTMHESNIETPNYITLGFGAILCGPNECPKQVTFYFDNKVYKSKRIEVNDGF
jgi:hypothetical protein